MFAKIRPRHMGDGQTTPFSVYLRFLKPKAVEGREVIWIEGRNDGKLVAHESGLLNIKRAWLDPKGYLAMMGQRYPVMEIGMRKLVDQLIKKGERDRQLGDCDVKFYDGAKVNGRTCRLIQDIHPEVRPKLDFHKVQIFILTTR